MVSGLSSARAACTIAHLESSSAFSMWSSAGTRGFSICSTAHAACSRTSGSGSDSAARRRAGRARGRRGCRGRRRRSAGGRAAWCAGWGCGGSVRGSPRRPAPAVPAGRGRQVGAGADGGVGGGTGELVPGADGQAVVAAVDARADEGRNSNGDAAFEFNREVGDAAAGVQLIRPGDGPGRAGGQAALARPAVRRLGRVGRQGDIQQESRPGRTSCPDGARSGWYACRSSPARPAWRGRAP